MAAVLEGGEPVAKQNEPEEVSFMLMDRENGVAVPVDSLPQEEWLRLRGRILWTVSKGIAEMMAREEP